MFALGVTVTEPRVRPPVENPLPEHDVAFVACQASVEERPEVMEVCEATKLMMGVVMTGLTLTVVDVLYDPWGPVQVTE